MSSSDMPSSELESWIKGLFQAFDRLEQDSFFLPHLDDDIELRLHGKGYQGISGFKQWMSGNRSSLKHGSLVHHSHSFEFKALEDKCYQVDFLLDFKAESVDGELFDHRVSEQWIVSDHDGKFKILRYLVEPIK